MSPSPLTAVSLAASLAFVTHVDWLANVMTAVPGHHCKMIPGCPLSVCDGAWDGPKPPSRPARQPPHHSGRAVVGAPA